LLGVHAALGVRLREDAITQFVTGNSCGMDDPTTMPVRGAALQAPLLVKIGGDTGWEHERIQNAFERGSELIGIQGIARKSFPDAAREGAESGNIGG